MSRVLALQGSRGATTVEYALALALFVVVSLAAVQALETRSGEALEQRVEVAEAREDYGYLGPSGPTPTDPGAGTPGDDTGTVAITVEGFTIEPQPSSGKNTNFWTASITFELEGTTGAGVVFEGEWDLGPNVSGASSCPTTTDGRCTVTALDINIRTDEVVFTLNLVGGDGVTDESGTEYPLIIRVCQSGPCPVDEDPESDEDPEP